MKYMPSRVYAFVPVAFALFSAACADEPRSVPTAAVAEAATLAGKRASATTALNGNIDITGISIETRYWDPLSGLPTDAAAATTFGNLATGTPGYTYPAVLIPNVGSAPSVLIDPVLGDQLPASGVRHPGTASTNIATRITISLRSNGPSTIAVRFGVDFLGGVVLLDGSPIGSNWNDPSWYGYWLSDERADSTAPPLWVTSPWDAIEINPLALSNGTHTIEVIGFENGDDFGTGGQIDLGPGYQDIVGPIPPRNLTVSKIGGGVGSVASAPTGINCGVDCAQPYDFGTVVTLTAAATPPSAFAGWGGACSGMSTACTLTMDVDHAVTAKFVTPPTVTAMTMETRYWNSDPLQPQPTIASALALFAGLPTDGVGYTNVPVPVANMVNNGALFTAPNVGANLDLATHTVVTFQTVGTSVLSVLANVDFSKGGGIWLDGTTLLTSTFGTETGVLTATMNLSAGNHTISVLGFEKCCDGAPSLEFDYGTGWVVVTAPLPPPQTLTVTTGAAGGRVTSQPTGIDCGTLCVNTFAAGSQVTLTATANPGYFFTGWGGGGCTGTGNPCVVRMNSAQYVTANFVKNTLTVVRAGTGGGSVVSAPAGINCGLTCNADFAWGDAVTLTATPDATSDLGTWSVPGCTGSTCAVTMQGSQTVTITFVRRTHALTVSKSGTGSGTVTSVPAGINCGTDCAENYVENTSVTLTAVPSGGSTFDGWTGAGCSGTGSCTVTMSQAQAVTAAFTRSADTVPPVISCRANPDELWPVNHKMRDIRVYVTVTDAGSGPGGFKLLSVTSNEPDDDDGDGHTSNDIAGWTLNTADVTGQLRAERAGDRRDRVYTISYLGFDVAGNTATASCTVVVPHDRGDRDGDDDDDKKDGDKDKSPSKNGKKP